MTVSSSMDLKAAKILQAALNLPPKRRQGQQRAWVPAFVAEEGGFFFDADESWLAHAGHALVMATWLLLIPAFCVTGGGAVAKILGVSPVTINGVALVACMVFLAATFLIVVGIYALERREQAQRWMNESTLWRWEYNSKEYPLWAPAIASWLHQPRTLAESGRVMKLFRRWERAALAWKREQDRIQAPLTPAQQLEADALEAWRNTSLQGLIQAQKERKLLTEVVGDAPEGLPRARV